MPELPDIVVYIERLRPRIEGQVLDRIRLASPFLLRSVKPPLEETRGRMVRGLRRLGKRIVMELDGDLFVVLHLMIAGRLRWKARSAKIPARLGLAAFDFAAGSYVFTARADDGIRVYVDGVLAIDEWIDQAATTYQATRTLSAGAHTIVVEYYERAGLAVAQVSWAPGP